MTQQDRLLAYLRLNGKLCSLAPYQWDPMIARTGARILDLKHAGHEIVSNPCKMHTEPTPSHVVYELVTADQGSLF